MADKTMDITILLKDRFSKGIKGVSANLATMGDIATAFRTARFANDKEWMKYIRKMTKV